MRARGLGKQMQDGKWSIVLGAFFRERYIRGRWTGQVSCVESGMDFNDVQGLMRNEMVLYLFLRSCLCLEYF